MDYTMPQNALQQTNPNKRKANDELIDIEDDRCQQVDISCDAVRAKIRNFINTGEMKVTEFQNAIGTTSRSYSAFMGQNGPDKGSKSDVYNDAFAFFKHRELNGIKAPVKKVKKDEEIKKMDVDGVQLEGEEEQTVPVYDTCDTIRTKIRAYLKKPDVTQAGFCRAIARSFGPEKKIQSKVLNDFLSKRGATAGNTSAVYYGAYVFFEKMRIRDGKPKNATRLEMEKIHPTGINTTRRQDRLWVHSSEVAVEDKYGRVDFIKK